MKKDWLDNIKERSEYIQKVKDCFSALREASKRIVPNSKEKEKIDKLRNKLQGVHTGLPNKVYPVYFPVPKTLARFIRKNHRCFMRREEQLLRYIIDEVVAWGNKSVVAIRDGEKVRKKMMSELGVNEQELSRLITMLCEKNIIKKEDVPEEIREQEKRKKTGYRYTSKRKIIFNPFIDTWKGDFNYNIDFEGTEKDLHDFSTGGEVSLSSEEQEPENSPESESESELLEELDGLKN